MIDEPEQPARTAEIRNPVAHLSSRLNPNPRELAEFSSFYIDHMPNLIAFLLSHGASAADSADVAQETMVCALKNWPDIESPKAWSRRVASRALVRRIASIEEDTIAEPERSALLPANSDIDSWVQQQDYYRILRSLPPRQRQVMAWTIEGYKPAEIADLLHLDPATVRSNLRKARRTIVIQLDGSDRA